MGKGCTLIGTPFSQVVPTMVRQLIRMCRIIHNVFMVNMT